MNNLSGESMMKIGWVTVTIIAIVFLVFYRNSIVPESRVAISGLIALAWCASSMTYAGGMQVKKKLRQRVRELESSKS